MLVLAVTSSRPNEHPAILLNHADDVAGFHMQKLAVKTVVSQPLTTGGILPDRVRTRAGEVEEEAEKPEEEEDE
jgi:hypothetical protein